MKELCETWWRSCVKLDEGTVWETWWRSSLKLDEGAVWNLMKELCENERCCYAGRGGLRSVTHDWALENQKGDCWNKWRRDLFQTPNSAHCQNKWRKDLFQTPSSGIGTWCKLNFLLSCEVGCCVTHSATTELGKGATEHNFLKV